MTSMLQDVVRAGTAARAQSLGRQDLAGKTGTTENYVDAWFDGYDPSQVAVAWIGFDQPRSLGKGEVGARAALPIWEDYMRVALKGVPDHSYAVPPGVVQASVHDASAPAGVDPWRKPADYFYAENFRRRLPPMRPRRCRSRGPFWDRLGKILRANIRSDLRRLRRQLRLNDRAGAP